MKFSIQYLLLLAIFSLPSALSATQLDSISNTSTNSYRSLKIKTIKNPTQAALRSAILPGWGQWYNRRWWKLPLVYGGFASMLLIYNFNNTYYKEFLLETQLRGKGLSGNLDYKGASDAGIISVRDFYRRNRDLTIICLFAFWGINIIDAYVDAKLFQFDVGNDLMLHVAPSAGQYAFTLNGTDTYIGLSLTMKWKD